MPVPKEFLDIYEEEIKKEKAISPPREFFWEKLRPRGEAIPEWTAKGEIVWRRREERKLTPKEEEEVSLAKEIKLLRQTADLGDRMEGFTQGLLPVGDKEILEKAFPLFNLGGQATRLIGTAGVLHWKMRGMTKAIELSLKQPMGPLAFLMKARIPQFLADPVTSVLFSESLPRVISFATQRAIVRGSNELGENIIRGITGKELSTKKLIWEPIGEAGFGAALGGASGVAGQWAASAITAGIGGGREAIEQYLKDGHLDREDIGDILTNAAMYGLVEFVAHTQMTSALKAKEYELVPRGIGKVEIKKHAGKAKSLLDKWRSQDFQDFMYNKYYAKLLGKGQTPDQAKTGASLMMHGLQPGNSFFRRAAYERVVKPNLPDQIKNAKPEVINKITDEATKKTSHFKSFADALCKTIGDHFKYSFQEGIENSILTQIDVNNEYNKYWERAKTAAKPEIIREANEAIANNQRHNEELKTRLELLRKRKPPKELPVYEEYEKLPSPAIKEGLAIYNQSKYGTALEEVLKNKLKYTDEDLTKLKQNKNFLWETKKIYKLENAMTDQEAARVIQSYEDILEQASFQETPSFRKTLKEVDKLRVKYLDAHEKGVFDEVLREKLPEELKGEIGKDWTMLDWIRPSWRAFRKDPVLFEDYQYATHQCGLWQRAMATAKQEARVKSKELGLTPYDRRTVTAKRHTDYSIAQGQKNLTPIILNEKQTKWDDWLTKQFEGLHSFFRLERMIPFHQYMPYITETDDMEKGFLSELYPEYLPKNITAFFEKRRQTKDLMNDKFREDSLELYEMYIKAGMKKKYMLPAIRRTRRYIIQNPNIAAGMKSHYQDWYTWQLGYPSLADSSISAFFTNMGLDYENAYRVARFMMDCVYMGGIGFRPMSAARNLFQTINTSSELGYTWTAAGIRDFMANGGTRHAEEMNMLVEYIPELYSELGSYSKMQKLRDASLFMFRKADEINRSVAYYGAEDKFNHFYNKHGNTDKFYQKSGIDFIDKLKRNEIKKLINEEKIDEARHEFGKEIVAKTQYLYAKENSPLIQKTIAGKLLFQFKSWPENYGELVADWGRNKNYMAFVRALMAYSALGFIGQQLGSRWLVKTIPLGALPMERWEMERALVPATLGPMADIIDLSLSPLRLGIETQDPEAVQKAFEKKLKNLGKDILLYMPGGLALKDFFRVAPTIPIFSGPEVPKTSKPFGELRFKSLGKGKSKLKFKEVFQAQ